ncbi:MAG: DNA-3-methyladenine glycosylase I [Saprospiraceae bacterium]
METKKRCSWCLKDELYQDYHDQEWGVPVHDDTVLFEYLNLEGAQAGLSWYTVLKKRESYRKAFANWDAKKISKFTPAKIEKLLLNKGIIRNKLKVNAVVTNAVAFLKVQKEFGSFNEYLWQFVNHQTIINDCPNLEAVPAKTELSDKISKDLKKRGFKFIGSTICYAFMQAIGMVDDHVNDCWKKRKQ